MSIFWRPRPICSTGPRARCSAKRLLEFTIRFVEGIGLEIGFADPLSFPGFSATAQEGQLWRGDGGRSAGGNTMAEPFDEDLSIRVQHDLDDARVIQRGAQLIAKRLLKLADEPRMGKELCHGFSLTRLGGVKC